MGKQARKFFPRRMSNEIKSRGEWIRRKALESIQSCKAVFRIFHEFCRLNDLPSELSSLPFYVAAMEQSLGIRTIRLYIRKVRKYLRYKQDPDGVLFNGIGKFCNLVACTAPRRHAVDISEEHLQQIFSTLLGLNPRVFLCTFMMATTGLRYADLKSLTRGCIEVKSARAGFSFRLDVRQTKSIRNDWLRSELVIPARLGLPRSFSGMVSIACSLLNELSPNDTVAPPGSTVDEFNQYFKDWIIRERSVTSYSFRRFALARFIEAYRDHEGIVDWNKAAIFSLHFKAGTLRAFYYKGVGEG